MHTGAKEVYKRLLESAQDVFSTMGIACTPANADGELVRPRSEMTASAATVCLTACKRQQTGTQAAQDAGTSIGRLGEPVHDAPPQCCSCPMRLCTVHCGRQTGLR